MNKLAEFVSGVLFIPLVEALGRIVYTGKSPPYRFKVLKYEVLG
ncbi:MAG: hypothetical protein OEY18_18965 [Candidatus Aminicenantes bacterium]|nr:hypothetical protein [Candidatus Aminicenantes bacterium]